MRAPALAAGLAAVLAAGLVVGSTAFGAAVALAALVLGVEACTLLAGAGPRPIVPAALLLAAGLPAAAVARPPTIGWTALPLVVALGVVSAFVLGIAFRRRGLVTVVGATMTAGLLVGLGSGGLVLLHLAPEGLRWVVGAVACIVAIDAARALATRFAPSARHARLAAPVAGGAVAVISSAVLATALTQAAGVAVAAVALGAVAAGHGLRGVLTVDAARERRVAEVTRWATPLLLAAPLLALLARFAAGSPGFTLFSF